ncbi:zinc finger protein CONSTANS-LIKE 16-like [Benincasa hispida]|uniref:zinc finger protein CONSTANS-LIKE 16-like n=1 Tax=Benincasa hispida TaxID=102211 RepID=UPI0019017619|nr:zinc finger protein CONSTANS-LIKE 16-like [Benincasa hispida]
MTMRKSVEKTVEGGKTARACDSCISKRARWYCAADDAFLCQACDASVHSANSLARRHERVRLQTASFRPSSDNSSAASWHQGFTKKPRSPRMGKTAPARKPFAQVPEVSAKEETEDQEQLLLHRVPVLGADSKDGNLASFVGGKESSNGYLSYDMDPAEFAADVESLLGNSLDNECFDMEELGLAASKEHSMTNDDYSLNSRELIKIEPDEIEELTPMLSAEADTMREPFELNFMDFGSNPTTCSEEDKVMMEVRALVKNGELEMEETNIVENKKKVSLSLDSEAVIIAWGSRGTPWTSGDRPNLDLDYYWPDYMGVCESDCYYQTYGELGGRIGRQAVAGVEGEREARVSRYREKRRTRLFAKKIRYEVRKLNAEKRPRMKGRFVKRSSCFPPPPLPLFN